MNHPKISVVIATHNRAKYFDRSLKCYAHQTFKEFEIILLDDSSTDDIGDMSRRYASAGVLDLKHFWFNRPGNKFRDCGSIMNYGIRAAAGDIIVTTSPEVMPGKTLLHQFSLVANQDTTFFTGKCYLLTRAMQDLIDTVPWQTEGIAAAIRKLPDFYNQPTADPTKHDTYLARNTDSDKEFVTNMMCGMSRKGWRTMGGYVECDVWGPGDLSWLAERNRRGVPIVTFQDPDSYSVHQNHDGPGDIITPRDMNLALQHIQHGPWDHIRW